MMEVGLKKLSFGAPLSTSISELSDGDDDCFALNDMVEDNTFEIPLKTRYLRRSNFSELTDDLKSPQGTSINAKKKVRFEGKGDTGEKFEESDDTDPVSRSRAESLKGKKNVEDLLNYANQVNEYLAQNLEKINTFRSELLNDKLPYIPSSDVATQATSISASMSNFELSDNELDEYDAIDSSSSMDKFSGEFAILNKSNSSLLDTVPALKRNWSPNEGISSKSSRITSNSNSNDHLEENYNDNTLENSPQLNNSNRNTDVFNSPNLYHQIENFTINSPLNNDYESNVSERDENKSCSMIINQNTLIHETPSLSTENGVEVLEETIGLILKLSHNDTTTNEDSNENNDDNIVSQDGAFDEDEYANFSMKSTPTLSYKQFISRIQSKCMFGPIVYLASAFLLQTLFLTRDKPNGTVVLRHRMQESETHRLVIASIRVATKLLEDFVHSHQYFCKVCGVSKKLLGKLEVSLMICLKKDGLVLTSERLAAAIQIRDELKACNR